jgi:hypothetical protein
MSDRALQRLARFRESLSIDADGRDKAGNTLLQDFLAACETAKFVVGKNRDGNLQIAPLNAQLALAVSTSAGDFFVGENNLEPLALALDYDPIAKAFVSRDPEGPDAVDILTDAIVRALEDKADGKRRKRSPG